MQKRWENWEIELLQIQGKSLSLMDLSNRLNRSVNSILKKASKEKISLRSNSWSPKEITFLKDNIGNVSCENIAIRLNKSNSSVYHKASRLKLKGRYFDYKDKIKSFKRQCKYCGAIILLKKEHCYSKMFKTEYCSRKCATLGTKRGFKKGQTPWNRGEEYSPERKELMSLIMKDKFIRNPYLLEQFNAMKKGRKSPFLGKSFEEIYGKEKSEEIKKKLKESTIKQYYLGVFSKKLTIPERILKEELIKNGLIEGTDFYSQKPLLGKRPDFIFPKNKTIIEVQGDFFHANPSFYPYDPDNPKVNLYPLQVKQIKKDKIKEEIFRENGWSLISLWEYDIKNNFHVISKWIIEPLKKKIKSNDN